MIEKMQNLLTVDNLTVGVGTSTVIRDMDFSVLKGETVVIIGSNGAGKSLLVRTLLGILPPQKGTVTWNSDVTIGYVPQKFSIPKHIPITVGEFLSLKTKIPKSQLIKTLNRVGLEKQSFDKPVRLLSGGQFQRMLVAWSLVDNPTVLVFDEPTESVDAGGQASIYSLIEELKKESGITVFLVTHDLDIVYKYGNRVICLSGGSMVCSSSPKESLSPELLEKIYGHDTPHHHH